MSGGTSAGNIITDAAATYAARTWVDITKVDAYGIISDAQLENVVGANWFNNVDDALIAVSAWMNGAGVAPHIRGTIGTIATLNTTAGNITTVTATAVNTTTAMVGAGALSDGVSTADDLVIGSIAATDRGLTILSTSVARLCFADTSATLTGYIAYTHATDTLSLGVGGATEVNLTAASLSPHADGGLALGTSSLKYSEAHVSAVTAYTGLTLGDATGSPVATLNRDTGGTGDIIFASESVTEWRLRNETGKLAIGRFSGGVLADSIVLATADGAATFPASLAAVSLALSAGATVGTTLGVTGNITGSANLSLTSDTPVLTIGNGNNTVSLVLDGVDPLIKFKETATNFELGMDGSDFVINRYSGGVYADRATYNSSGAWSFPGAISFSNVASKFTAGTGAPAGGSNGDLYWRTDGTKSTCLYQRAGGVWAALAT